MPITGGMHIHTIMIPGSMIPGITDLTTIVMSHTTITVPHTDIMVIRHLLQVEAE